MLLIDSPVDNCFRVIPKSENKTEFRILQVTDMHLDRVTPIKARIFREIKEMIDNFHPDLIVNTGDMFCHSPPFYIRKILRDFDKKVGIPWAFAWGNHDCENFKPGAWFKTFDEIESYLNHLPHCLYSPTRNFIENFGSDSIQNDPRECQAYLNFLNPVNNASEMVTAKRFDGFYGGNYRIQILHPQTRQPVWNLFIMNSRRDHHIPPKALRWMKDSMEKDSPKLPAMLFYHVPNYEYEIFWNEKKAHGIKGERVCFEGDRGEIHAFLKTLGTIKGVFVGHDHVNDYYVDVDGIRYSYGRKTGVLAYGGDWNLKNQYLPGKRAIKPGATLITLNFDGATPLANSWTHCSVFPNGSTWIPNGMEDMGTIR
jgi:predicted MPP superfamily phosphohydrolase